MGSIRTKKILYIDLWLSDECLRFRTYSPDILNPWDIFRPTVKKTLILIINTCAVRQKAEEKLLSKLGKLRSFKRNPEMLLVLWGCMMQQKGIAEKISNTKFISLIGGPHSLQRFPQLLEKAQTSSKTLIDTSIEGEKEHPHIKRGHSFKAWIPISHGCNNFCTYCVVPYVRVLK